MPAAAQQAIRAASVAVLFGAIAALLVVDGAKTWFWAGLVAALPLAWVVFGYHAWRLACPLAAIASAPAAVGRGGKRKAGKWLAKHAVTVQLAVLFVALTARLVIAEGPALWVVLLLVVVAAAALITGALFTGRTWCHYLCPVGPIERIYTEPTRRGRVPDSRCATCTACMKHCPDIELEQGYWRASETRRSAYFCWPGLVAAFGLHAYLQAHSPSVVGASAAVPVAITAPLLLACGAALSFGLFALAERTLLASGAMAEQKAQHRLSAVAGFVAFNVFYVYAAAPLVGSLPRWLQSVFLAVVVAASTAVLVRRWFRTEQDFVHERFARGLLRRTTAEELTGSSDPARLTDLYAIHHERKRARKELLATYKETLREVLDEGVVTRAGLGVLDAVRNQLGITTREHDKAVKQLGAEDRQLFDPDYLHSVEHKAQLDGYRAELVRLAAATNGVVSQLSSAAVAEVRVAYNVSDADHERTWQGLVADDTPVVRALQRHVEAIALTAGARADIAALPVRGDADDAPESATAFGGFVADRCRARADEALAAIRATIGPLLDDEAIARDLTAPDADSRKACVARLAKVLSANVHAEVARAVRIALAEPPPLHPDALLVLARDRERQLRAATIALLARRDDERARAATVAGTDDPEPMVREAAYWALFVRERLTAELIMKAGGDPDRRVGQLVSNLLGMTTRTDTAVGRAAQTVHGVGKADAPLPTLDESRAFASLTLIERIVYLHRVRLLADLPLVDLERLAVASPVRELAAGDVLFREGASGRTAYVVCDGAMEVSIDGAAIAVVKAAGVLGELAILDRRPRTATATAVQHTRLLEVTAEDFRALLHSSPTLPARLVELLGARLRATLEGRRS